MTACAACGRAPFRLGSANDPEAARYILAGWAGTTFATLAVLGGNPVAAVAVSLPALAFFVFGVFA